MNESFVLKYSDGDFFERMKPQRQLHKCTVKDDTQEIAETVEPLELDLVIVLSCSLVGPTTEATANIDKSFIGSPLVPGSGVFSIAGC